MAMLTVRNLPDEVHRALRVRAAQNGRSMEAEVRQILQFAVLTELVEDSVGSKGPQSHMSDQKN